MKEFNVLIFDFNSRKLEYYNIIPYLVECYNKKSKSKRPKSFDEFKGFIKGESMYQWWARCEYELVITGFPRTDKAQKIDVYYQVLMNLDIITEIVMQAVNEKRRVKTNN